MAEENETRTIVVCSPEQDPEVIRCVLRGNELLQAATDAVIDSPEGLTWAAEYLSTIGTLKNTLSARRVEMLAPLKAETELINEAFKTIMEPVDQADKLLRTKANAHLIELQRKKEEADRVARMERDAEEARAALEGKAAPTMPVVQQAEVKTHIKTEAGSIAQKMNTMHEVVDFAALPDMYKMVDAGKLTRQVKSGGPNQVIAGVRIWQEPSLQVSR